MRAFFFDEVLFGVEEGKLGDWIDLEVVKGDCAGMVGDVQGLKFKLAERKGFGLKVNGGKKVGIRQIVSKLIVDLRS